MEKQAMVAKRNPYAKFHLDSELVKAGIWYEDEDVRVKVTYAGSENSRYDKMLKLKLKPYETRIKNDNFPDSEFHKVLGEVYAVTVVVAWEVRDENGNWVSGIYNEEGDIMDFCEENIIKGFALGNRLFLDVIKVASNFNLFRQVQKDESIKK